VYKITTKRADETGLDVKAEGEGDIFGLQPIRITATPYRSAAGEKVARRRGAAAAPEGAGERPGHERQGPARGSVSLRDGKPVVRLWKDGKEDTPLDANSPYWMEVRILDGDGKPAKEIPLKGGYFEMQLPKALFEGNPKAITVSWIDFYRN